MKNLDSMPSDASIESGNVDGMKRICSADCWQLDIHRAYRLETIRHWFIFLLARWLAVAPSSSQTFYANGQCKNRFHLVVSEAASTRSSLISLCASTPPFPPERQGCLIPPKHNRFCCSTNYSLSVTRPEDGYKLWQRGTNAIKPATPPLTFEAVGHVDDQLTDCLAGRLAGRSGDLEAGLMVGRLFCWGAQHEGGNCSRRNSMKTSSHWRDDIPFPLRVAYHEARPLYPLPSPVRFYFRHTASSYPLVTSPTLLALSLSACFFNAFRVNGLSYLFVKSQIP
ncbi:unnamed protein product [Protopolystoma xenopodis]|uniref:Uncharacterized protein n=1 Tax=Protopolystoma xenopodis TaxID=117903 RepID=A0A3S5AEE0_9PLAT|nr:unnamed protein product [Protopolystoma xenopodis]